MVLILLIIWTTVLLVSLYLRKVEKVRNECNIPSPPMIPIVGHALYFFGKTERFIPHVKKWWKDHKRLLGIWLGPWLNIVIFNPTDAEIILKHAKTEKSYHYTFLKPWLGDSLLISGGEKFLHIKKVMMHDFRNTRLKTYFHTFNENAMDLVDNLQKHLGKGEFNVIKYLEIVTMTSALETLLGVSKKNILEDITKYSHALEKVTQYSFLRVFKFWLYHDYFFNRSDLKKKQDQYLQVLNEITLNIIQNRRRNFDAIKSAGLKINEYDRTFLDTFFENKNFYGEPYNEQEILDEVMTIMFAGQDTSTVHLGFTLSLLGIHQNIQDTVYEELYKVFGDSNRPVTFEDLTQLKYLERVMFESLRLYPPIPLIARKLKEDVYLDGCILPKNATAAILIIGLHRHPDFYPNPNQFDPDNFLPDRIRSRPQASFIPFSMGLRTCIGMKYSMLVLKVILIQFLRHYKVMSNWKERDFVLTAQMTLKRKEGFPIIIEKRDKMK